MIHIETISPIYLCVNFQHKSQRTWSCTLQKKLPFNLLSY